MTALLHTLSLSANANMSPSFSIDIVISLSISASMSPSANADTFSTNAFLSASAGTSLSAYADMSPYIGIDVSLSIDANVSPYASISTSMFVGTSAFRSTDTSSSTSIGAFPSVNNIFALLTLSYIPQSFSVIPGLVSIIAHSLFFSLVVIMITQIRPELKKWLKPGILKNLSQSTTFSMNRKRLFDKVFIISKFLISSHK